MDSWKRMAAELLRKPVIQKNRLLSVMSAAVVCVMLTGIFTGITYFRRTVTIVDGNETKVVYTNQDSPFAVLSEAGVELSDRDLIQTADISERESEIVIHRAFRVPVTADGETKMLSVAEGTVQDALDMAGVEVGEDDLINASLSAPLSEGTEIEVNRVTYRTVTETEEVDYETEVSETIMKRRGTIEVLQEGQKGVKTITKEEKLVDGEVVEVQTVSEEITQQPVTRKVLEGTCPNTPRSPLTPPSWLKLDENGKPTNYKYVISGKAAAYSSRPGASTTGTYGAFVGNIAVNYDDIPKGSKLYVTTPDNSYVYGYAVAADTGTALVQDRIVADLYMGSYAEACAFGIKDVNIYVLE